jgi:NAD(P)-dependent dehydrogenase (short-subunit alcohol dehydrogenase family)
MDTKICFVTGGSKGIGRGIAIELANQGYNVAFTYNTNKNAALAIENDMAEKGFNVKAFRMNIEERHSINNAICKAEEHFSGHIAVLINNAAIAQEKPLHKITDHDWEKMLKINLQGPFICTQEVLPKMKETEWGRIVNITSIGGQWGGFNQVHYAASKAALINFTQSIAKIHSIDGITCNAIAIGLVDTEMSGPELTTEKGKKKVANIPIGRIGEIQEIAHAVTFLVSKGASYITGQTINLNGGMYFG